VTETEKWDICLECGAICFPQKEEVCLKCKGKNTEKGEITLEEIAHVRSLIRLWKLDSKINISVIFTNWDSLPAVLVEALYNKNKNPWKIKPAHY